MKTIIAILLLLVASLAMADGLTINVPVVARVVGSGNTLFLTSIDVTNNGSLSVPVDFYFDARDGATSELVSIRGSIGSSGLVERGAGSMSPLSNQHFEDFVSALVEAGLLSARFRDDGLTGSLLLVFNGYNKSGQGSATARFYNAFGGGTVGVSARGHEITAGEPTKLVVTARDTTAVTGGASQIYPNLFINNTGLTPSGTASNSSVTVRLSAVSPRTHQSVGINLDVSVPSGQTATVSHVFQALGVTPSSTETTLLVYATVISGTSAIEGLLSQVDTVTRDGSAFEASRADF